MTGVLAPPTTDELPPPPKYVVRARESEGASLLVQHCHTDKELWRLLDFLITERKSFTVEVERWTRASVTWTHSASFVGGGKWQQITFHSPKDDEMEELERLSLSVCWLF